VSLAQCRYWLSTKFLLAGMRLADSLAGRDTI
jgi:hypothetical protein